MRTKTWGNRHGITNRIIVLRSGQHQCNLPTGSVAFGALRSYNDAPVAANSVQVPDSKIIFDPDSGIVTASGGTTLEAINELLAPQGYFLPVVPGTQKITLGGAIAANVHGKNHHKAGSFSEHVVSMKLLDSNGKAVQAAPGHPLFDAVPGSFGLTAVILEARVRAAKIPGTMIDVKTEAMTLAQLLDALRDDQSEFSVAWIDSSDIRGRGIFMQGDWAAAAPATSGQKKRFSVPPMPSLFLKSRSIVSLMCRGYYSAKKKPRSFQSSYEAFLFPLDRFENWDNAFGATGMLQLQVVLSDNKETQSVIEILLEELNEFGLCSFVTVLKRFRESPGRYGEKNLDCHIDGGYTFAMDIPGTEKAVNFAKWASRFCIRKGGKVYLAKDSVLQNDQLSARFKRQVESFAAMKKDLDPHGVFVSSLWGRLHG